MSDSRETALDRPSPFDLSEQAEHDLAACTEPQVQQLWQAQLR